MQLGNVNSTLMFMNPLEELRELLAPIKITLIFNGTQAAYERKSRLVNIHALAVWT